MTSQEDVIDLQALNLKDDEATAEGTRAVRYLVRRLQEAQANPVLGPTVQALMRSNNMESVHPPKSPQRESVSRQGREDESKEEGREKSSSQEISQERRPSNPLVRFPK